MEYSAKFRIYPDAGQRVLIAKTFGCRRYVYNHYLALRESVYRETGETMNYNACAADLVKLKQEHEWLQEVDSIALQCAVKDLDTAFRNFFRGCKSKKRVGYPKYKSKRNLVQSYQTKQHIELSGKAVKLPKLGWIKCRVSKQVSGRILSATVSRSASGKYFVSICWTDVVFSSLPKTGQETGLDLGIKSYVTYSDGSKIANPVYFRKSEKRLARAQRRLSRKQKGSKRYAKQKLQAARVCERVSNQRRDFLQKLSTDIVRNYDFIGLEDLYVAGMAKNHYLAKSIQDAGWSELRRELEYKAAWYGKRIQVVPRFYASSQICHCCGHKNPDMKSLNVRTWVCPCCHTLHDRDANAVLNILNKAKEIVSVA